MYTYTHIYTYMYVYIFSISDKRTTTDQTCVKFKRSLRSRGDQSNDKS